MNKLIKIIIVSLCFNYVSYSQDINDKQIIEYAIDNIEEFKDFLSYPNDANKRSDIVNLIKWCQENFQNLGFNITKLQTPTIPLLLAEKIYKNPVYLKTKEKPTLDLPDFLSVEGDKDKPTGVIVKEPTPSDIPLELNTGYILEYYGKVK